MQSSCTAAVDGQADSVFAALTDLEHLHDWNDVIIGVVERPAALDPGAQWVVEMRALGQRWRSRSTVIAHDPAARRFSYRSQTDDGNPSFAEWAWAVSPLTATTSQVTVTWHLHPATFWRRVLLARIRGRQLRRREVPASIRRLAAAAAPTPTET